MKSQVAKTNLKKVLISTIAGIFLVFGCLTLTACGESSVSSGQTPVYQGMKISSAESSSASLVCAEYFDDYGNYYDGNGGYFDKFGEYHTGNYNPYQGDYSGRNEDIDCKKPFGDETPSIEKQIESSLKVVGAGQSIYYADKNEDIFITIKFSNPDSFEILSFVLNGTKYTSYMFQEDSDLENIIIKLNVGSYGGILEYTIDEIKYVDGKEIKDVLLNGDTVVKCGVRADDLTYVTVSDEMHDLSSISFTAEIVDIYDLIESSDGYAMAFLYDGESLVQSTNLTVGTNEVQFTSLSPNTLYQYAVVAYYDDLSGEGTALNYLYTNAVYTDAIVLFDEIEISHESISFSYSWYEGYNNTTITALILTKDDESQTLTSSTTYVNGLLSNTQYTLTAYYTNLNNQTESISLSFSTKVKSTPTVEISTLTSTQTEVGYSLGITDTDSVGAVTSVSLLLSGETVQILTTSTGTFSGLLSNNTYTLSVVYKYNLNDGVGDQTLTVTQDVTTQAKSTPTVEINTFSSTQTGIDYGLKIADIDSAGAVTSVSLLLSGETVQTLTTSTGTFSGLLSNNTYTLSVVYKYNLNDGVGEQTLTVTQDVTTQAKSIPTVGITLSESDSENLTFSISYIDEDDVGEITAISLYSNSELVASASDVSKTSVTFSNLSENTQYTLVVYYSFDLNEGDGFINASEEIYVYTDFVLGFDSFEVLNTSAVSEGETITVQAELYNPNNVTFTQVIVNDGTYEVSSLSTSKKLLVEILNDGQFVGGDTELTISAVYCTYNNETYLVELSGNNTASVFINGELTVENISVVRLSNDVYEESYYGFYSEQIYYKVSLDNITGYEVYSLIIGGTTYNAGSITMSDDMQTVYVAISKESYGMKYPTLSSISYCNSSLDKTKATDVSTYYVRLKSDEIVGISTANDLLDMDDYKYYKLVDDIDLSSYEWANMNNNMYGVFDGNGYSIKNMRAVATYSDTDLYLGLFKAVSGFVFDLTISDALFVITLNNTTGNSYKVYAGALASENDNITVSDCDIDISMSLTNANTSGYTYIGGLIGYISASYITLEEIQINAVISASTQNTSYVGGVVGYILWTNVNMSNVTMDLSATISSSTNYDSYFGYANLSNCDCNISDCTATSKFTVSDTVYYYDNEFIFLYEDGEYSLVDYLGKDTYITLPNSINGKTYSIGNYAFYENTSLKSIIISDGVTSIGERAFYNCTGLTSITIPDSVTSIGALAFDNCTNLTSVTIGSSVTSIGENAFSGCSALTEINFNATAMDASSSYVFDYAGQNGDGITVNIGSNVTKIPAYLFYASFSPSTPNITSVVFSVNSVCESIGSYAFYYCTNLTNFTIPNSVTSIGEWAFSGFTSLTSITIPDSVTSIGSSAFYGCTGLTSVTIGSSVTTIGSYAFYGCKALTKINFNATAMDDLSSSNYVFAYAGQSGDGITVSIGANVTKIPKFLFNPYSSTSSAYAPKVTAVIFVGNSVCTSIGNAAFSGCSDLVAVYVESIETWLGISFESITANPLVCAGNLYVDGSLLTSLIVPSAVETINAYAFYACTCLKSITIESGVTSIGEYAFCGCTGLTSVTISDSVTSIGIHAFHDCSNLTDATIGSGMTCIGEYAFCGCTGLTSVTFTTTSGWTAGTTSIVSTNLTSTSTAATYLTSTYYKYTWTRS